MQVPPSRGPAEDERRADQDATRWEFRGPGGIQRLSGSHLFSAEQPADFRASVTRVRLDHIALEAFRATPHRSIRGPQQITEHPGPYLSFVHIAGGGLNVRTGRQQFDLEAGDCAIIDGRAVQDYTVPSDVRLLRTVVGIEHVPGHLRDRDETVIGPLPTTILVRGFVAFCSALLGATASGHAVERGQLVRIMEDLHRSVLAEARDLTRDGPGSAGPRLQMERYIEAHLSDPLLDPKAVAAAVGVSLRRAHALFNDESRTISRYITDRRVDAVAAELRAGTIVPLRDLAVRHGFSGADAMARAFRARLAMTPTQYRRSPR